MERHKQTVEEFARWQNEAQKLEEAVHEAGRLAVGAESFELIQSRLPERRPRQANEPTLPFHDAIFPNPFRKSA